MAESLHADLLLLDERKGVNVARRRGFRVTGTLGLLEVAAQERLIDFADAVERLWGTTFRGPEELLAAMPVCTS
jgi:predicted nucleic acid-binding protein